MRGGTGQAPAVFGTSSRGCFEQVLAWLEGNESATLSHGELEEQLECRGRELLRRLLQDHLSLRATTEERLPAVTDHAGVLHTRVEAGHRRVLASVFGQVNVQRLAYRHRGHRNLCPADGLLNLPVERHSHGLRRLAAIESSRGSFEQAARTGPRWEPQASDLRKHCASHVEAESLRGGSTPPGTRAMVALTCGDACQQLSSVSTVSQNRRAKTGPQAVARRRARRAAGGPQRAGRAAAGADGVRCGPPTCARPRRPGRGWGLAQCNLST